MISLCAFVGVEFQVVPVPEPSAVLLVAAGAGLLARIRFRRRFARATSRSCAIPAAADADDARPAGGGEP